MKRKKKWNPFARTIIFLSVLLFMIITTAICLFYYVFSIPEPEGLSLASWPETFTDNFSIWLEHRNETIHIQEIGLKRLDEYGLWIQIMDESGQEVFSHNKPRDYPTSYSASELLALNTSAYDQDHTVFSNSFQDSGKTWSYIIGFPYAIGKYMLYYNGENFARLSPVARITIFSVLGVLTIFVLGYGFWLSRKLARITDGIKNVLLRAYQPVKENGMFGEIYVALNQMDQEMRHADRVKEATERMRREWISNITHDLKTPLSPVKGYAELLADGSPTDLQAVQEYGSIILKNVNHVEKLINDLKLTYQLDSGAIPYHPKEARLIRYLKEWVIDIVNDPAFSGRTIVFEPKIPEQAAQFDPDLLGRAVQNIIVNALIHNPPDTKVTITVELPAKNRVCISIRDNGVGISESEQAKLFNRYYRGTNTEEKPEGSGLGLAIAKQIVTLHGGDIRVKSRLHEGTEFAIYLPFNNRLPFN